jgi:hypothetical protein
MIEALDRYESGEIDLAKLVDDLRGLLKASDLQASELIGEFWNHFQEIDMELELRTEGWVPPGSASDTRLREALASYRTWVSQVLASTDDRRS